MSLSQMITVMFRSHNPVLSSLLIDFVCLYTYEFWLSLCKIDWSSVILLLPLFEGDSYSTRFPYKIIVLLFKSNTTGATRGVGNLFPIWKFQWALDCPIFSFLCSISSTIALSVFLLFVIMLSVLRLWCLITPFGIFKLFIISTCNNYLNRC
jgi:hypothetical protein